MRQITDGDRMITLNAEQNVALDKMFIWFSSGGIFFLLEGYAGTGKTTLAKFFMDSVKSEKVGLRPLRMCVAAPTHKAKRVIGRKTEQPAHTLQRLLGLGPDISIEDFDPAKPEFKQKREPIIQEYDLIVMDEASMINEKLFNYIHEHIGTSTKMLFMGDPAQLPPVKEIKSPVFTSELIRARAELTTVERNAGPILHISAIIRDNITSTRDVFRHQNMLERGPDGLMTGVVFEGQFAFAADVLTAFLSEEYIEDPNYAKIMCWHNDQCTWWNKGLRKKRMEKLHPNQELMPVMQGDLLMGFNSYEGKIQNSNDYLVLHVEPSSFPCWYPDKNGGRVKVILKTHGTKLVNVDTGGVMFSHILDQDDEKNVDNFLKAHWGYVHEASLYKAKWKDYFEFRSWVVIMRDIKTRADGKFTITKDLDYGYAITVHKSQGSEYTNVFVDGIDIDENWKPVERNSLKYVAISRASRMVYYRDRDSEDLQP